MADGARHFAETPWRPPLALKDQLTKSPGVTVTKFLDSTTETWIDFEYRGFSFTAHNPLNDFWLFVADPACPDELLGKVKQMLA